MARYTGPRTRIARKFGEAIFGADKVLSKKNYPPGQHGNSRKRKTSEYGIQLREKQKAKYTYGVLEKQFRNLFEKASRSKGITGEVLLQLLEGRLDNVVYRLGIAPTRAAAQMCIRDRYDLVNQVNAIKKLERVSTPGLRKYTGYKEMPRVLNGLGIAVLSTSKGVMTDKEARDLKIGGEVLCYVY